MTGSHLRLMPIQNLIERLSHGNFNINVHIKVYVEYVSTVWSPTYLTLIDQLESVQRSFTKRLPECQHLSYSERLNKLQLQSLGYGVMDGVFLTSSCDTIIILCREILVLTEIVFFYQNESKPLYAWSPFSYILVPLAKLNARNFFFCNRIVQFWNSLPTYDVEASSVQSFEFRIQKVDLTKFLRSN